MKPVASEAAKLSCEEQEAAELRGELHLMKTAGIIEVAVRNPSVAEYMAHWEGRAISAEGAISAANAAIEDLRENLFEWSISPRIGWSSSPYPKHAPPLLRL